MEIREISIEDRKLIDRIAHLHQKAFPSFFLTQLGIPFLKTLYKGYLDDADSGIIIAEESGKIKGFIAYSNDYPRFYRGLIRHKIIQFAWCSFLAVIRHPSFAKRLLGAFGKSESVEKKERYVELASICTDPAAEGQGIGTALIDHLKSMIDFNKYAFINLETDAEDNEKAKCFYIKNGFRQECTYITAEGRKMIEFRYYDD